MEVKVPVEVYSRVVGYFRPVAHWNNGKREEFKERKVIPNEKITEFINKIKEEYSNKNS